ncbi:Sugar phosphate isomerase/epimerase [Saccharopolyspora antimicrobica]|uniref:Sugar phosphate isomerase/epimerase n=1 Tax=Saccharopolyspora antimicrobica TaxID=455193 RepID=A0A1I4S042_9PSEU|nr:sugar phosphate isomerase/epimerase family protein [Saccharopolyspora antimicrobica]RKT89222.1 sugar phosphate isomerase/epimerase [Saccharopolyspora antimicrobica]SFM57932.1 Sugar phosphate isomerase/epimerase [Saccharopolyspora antimicrobica]
MRGETAVNRLAGIGDEAAVGLPGQIAAIRELGWSAVELRTVDGIALGDLDASQFTAMRSALRAAELDVVCLASRIGNWARPITTPFADDLRELDVLAGQCAELGTRFIRIMSYPNDGLPEADWRDRVLDRIARLAERAAGHGVVLVHENCAGWAGHDAERMLRLISEVNSPSLRLLFDVGNGIDHGYDAHELLVRILPHVVHVHVKDAVGTPGNAEYVLPGDGHARVAECLRQLLTAGYTGPLSIEPHFATRPHEGLRAHGSAAQLFVQAGRRLEQLLRTCPEAVAS